MPIAKLSEADVAYLKTTFPNGKSPELLVKGAGKKGSPAAAPATGPVKVELVGLAVTKALEALPAEVSPLPAGTHLYLLVSNPELNLTGIDTEKSKIVSCTDNKNTDLTEGQGSGVIEFQPLLDGKSGLVHLHQPKCPAAKSVRLALKGELHLTTGAAGDGSPTVRVPLNLDVNLGL